MANSLGTPWDWKAETPDDISRTFTSFFDVAMPQIPIKEGLSTWTHTVGSAVLAAHCESLKGLKSFKLEEISVQGVDYSMATSFFQSFCPYPQNESWWDPTTAVNTKSRIREISSEEEAAGWFEVLALDRASAAAACLWGHVTKQRGGMSPFHLWGSNFALQSRGATGAGGGRVDKTLAFQRDPAGPEIKFAGVEVKTSAACTYQKADLFPLISGWLGEARRLFRWANRQPIYGTTNEESWCRKARKILLQVWIEMRVQQIRHIVLTNERSFVLCIMDDDKETMRVSCSYDLSNQAGSPLTALAYFLFLAIMNQPFGVETAPPPSPLLLAQTLTTESQTQPAAHSHDTPRGTTTRSTEGQGLGGKTTTARAVDSLPLLSKLLHTITHILPWPSTKLTLTLTWDTSPLIWVLHPLEGSSVPKQHHSLQLVEPIHGSPVHTIYRGKMNDKAVVAKHVDLSSSETLRHEWNIYCHLKSLQGSAIPHCYGLFAMDYGAGLILLLEDCGRHVVSLNSTTRANLSDILKKIHSLGIQHGDLELRNVVSSGGKVRVIDFELSSSGHVCDLSDSCLELAQIEEL